MKTIQYSAETERFLQKEDGIYWLSGWCFSRKGGDVSFSVCDERGKILPSSVRWVRRPDVEAFFPDVRVPERCGFELDVPHLERILQNCRILTVRAEADGERVRICRHTVRELQEGRERCRLMSYIDELNRRETDTRVTGWAFGPQGACEIELLDEKGEVLSAPVKRIRRKDIELLYRLEDAGRLGFEITVLPDQVFDNKIRLRYTSGELSREDVIDLERGVQNGRPDLPVTGRVFSAEKLKRAASVLRSEGLQGVLGRLRRREAPAQPVRDPEKEYMDWFLEHRATAQELERQRERQAELPERPLLSVAVPLYNTRPDFLEALLRSVLDQTYPNWELCLADGSTTDETGEVVKRICGDDPRVKYTRLTENMGIAGNTNAAIGMASGDYVCLADHDDLLEPDAFYEIAAAISEDPSADVLYTDEDLTDESGAHFTSPRFKPDFNLDFLRSINYICHIFLVRRNILQEVGGFRKEFDGAQDWDMILRCCEKAGVIRHIPRVLYHWRAHDASTAGNPESKEYAIDAGRRAVQAHFERCGMQAELEYTDIFVLFRPVLQPVQKDRISIIICNKDQADTLSRCVTSILEKSTYDNYEIVIVENNSTQPETFALYDRLCADSPRVKVVRFEGAFNYPAVNRCGVDASEGKYLILLNNDTEVITPDWMERMLAHCQRDDVAAAGAKLLYPDDTVQHCGAVIGLGGFAGHILTGAQSYEAGYFGRLQAVQDISAVTAACMMVSREAWDQTGGMDESFAVALNDMDFCLRIRETGQLIVLDPGVQLYHHESLSRGSEESPEKRERFKNEIRHFRSRWAKVLEAGDPYYSPNLTLLYNDCRVRQSHETVEYADIMAEIMEEDRRRAGGA